MKTDAAVVAVVATTPRPSKDEENVIDPREPKDDADMEMETLVHICQFNPSADKVHVTISNVKSKPLTYKECDTVRLERGARLPVTVSSEHGEVLDQSILGGLCPMKSAEFNTMFVIRDTRPNKHWQIDFPTRPKSPCTIRKGASRYFFLNYALMHSTNLFLHIQNLAIPSLPLAYNQVLYTDASVVGTGITFVCFKSDFNSFIATHMVKNNQAAMDGKPIYVIMGGDEAHHRDFPVDMEVWPPQARRSDAHGQRANVVLTTSFSFLVSLLFLNM